MKHWAFILLFLILIFQVSHLAGQRLSTSNGQSEKFYLKSESLLRERNFDEAIALLKKAIRKDPGFYEAHLRLATVYNLLAKKDSSLVYYNNYAETAPYNKVPQPLWLVISRMNLEKGDYEKAEWALKYVRTDDLNFKDKTEHQLLKSSVDFSKSQISNNIKLKVTELPREVNRYGLQYFPVLTVDENTLIYTKRDSYQPNAMEDIVVSKREQGAWTESTSISDQVNSEYNEGAATISADGRTLIFTSCEGRKSYGSCDLYISSREGDHWSVPQNLGPQVNSNRWESQPSLSADGKTLYFSSDRPGGFGKRDIWVSRVEDGQWSTPKNLGPMVNSYKDDITPFIHANGRTLFFSTDGRPGLGGYDLYATTRKDTLWQKPVNLGHPINTYHDEVGLFITASGRTGYFSKEISEEGRVIKSDIVSCEFPYDSLIESKASYVTGLVADAETHEPLQATFLMANLDDDSEQFQVTSDSITGRYFLVLNEGNEYGVFVSKKNYLFEDLTFTTTANSALEPDTVDILLHPIREGKSLILENIYFEFDKYTLSRRSVSEMEQIVKFLETNPNIVVRIEGHTDNVGGREYNQKLSENRARTVYEYLVNRGVKASRLSYVGYGMSQPKVPNADEASQKINRRIEFKIIKAF